MNQQLIYFADPMCSWCWGFSPAMEAVTAKYGDQLPVRLILGGLLMFLGLSLLTDWVVDGWGRLSRGDYTVVILILLTVGFMPSPMPAPYAGRRSFFGIKKVRN